MTTQLLPQNGLIGGVFIATPGTSMPFHMSAPPLGWVQSVGAGFSDAGLRATNVGTSSGGSTGWTGWSNGNTINLNSFTLSTAQLPAHSHSANDPGHFHTWSQQMWTYDGTANSTVDGFNSGSVQVNAVFTSNDAGLSTQNTGSSASITPTITMPSVKFTNFCVAIKS